MADRLSPIESIMWRAGRDPTLRMTVGALIFLDHSPGSRGLEEHIASVAERTPRLRRRPDDVSGLHLRPAWIEDDALDVPHHVRSLAMAHGSRRQLLDLVAMFDAVAFDPDRPPWDVTLVEGFDGGGAALYFRAHHVVTDGLGGLRLLGALLDETEWPRAIRRNRARAFASDEARDRTPDRPTGTITIDVKRAIRPLRRSADAARELDLAGFAVRGVQHALDIANSVSRQVMVTGGPLSPLFDDQSSMSRFELLSMADARRVARAFGGSRNDLIVAVVAAGLGLYHDRMGTKCRQLRLATPAVSGRTAEIGGNWFVPARVEVPVDAEHPGPLFGMIAERLTQARNEPALRLSNAVAAGISMLPSRAVLPALRMQAESVDFAATALPGLRRRRHLAGAAIDALYPFGPRLGCPVNVTGFGNEDRLDIGIALDAAAIDEPDMFLESMHDACTRFGMHTRTTEVVHASS
jgi:diacylglycerol O-acyltransferase